MFLKMRMLYIANVRLPTEKAHGLQIMKMCEAFSENGIDLKLAVPRKFFINKLFLKQISNLFEYYSIKETFKIKKLFCLDFLILDKYLSPLPYYLLNLSFSLSAVFYALTSNNDLFYTRSFLIAILLSLFCPKKTVFEAHEFPKNKIMNLLSIFFFKKIRAIVTISQGLKNKFIEFGVNEKQILVAHDATSKDFFKHTEQKEAREKLKIPLNKNIIMYVGSLYKWKGIYTLAESANFLGNDCLIYFIGYKEGDIESENFKKFVSKQKNNHNIKIINYVNPSLTPLYLSASSVLVLPNSGKEDISKYYTSPLKLFEYMASKKPIIASCLPSIEEILNKDNSILIKPDDPLALSKAITSIITNKALEEKISTNAYKKALQCTWTNRANKIIEFI